LTFKLRVTEAFSVRTANPFGPGGRTGAVEMIVSSYPRQFLATLCKHNDALEILSPP